MTRFENWLINKGYIKFRLNCKTMRFEIPETHTISTMVNLDHRYFHKDEANVLSKISAGISVIDFAKEDRKGEITFGLNEAYKPPSLIWPRPLIKIKRIKDGKAVITNEDSDDAMNMALESIDYQLIFEAMYNSSIVLMIDLTKTNAKI